MKKENKWNIWYLLIIYTNFCNFHRCAKKIHIQDDIVT